jgi:hypothetical protein
MKKWLRRIRGAIGMGLTWGVAWFTAGIVLALIVGFDAADVPFPLGFGFLGFLSGITFSGVLGLMEGRRRFDQMSLPRFATWGGAGGLLFAGLFVLAADLGLNALVVLGPVFALAGGGCAAGSLALARMAEDRALLDSGDEAHGAGLTEEERRDLLGEGG